MNDKYVTIKEAWRRIFPELWSSKAPVAIAMSHNIFKPEIKGKERGAHLLSEADLCVLFFLNRCWQVGLSYAAFKAPMEMQSPDWGAVRVVYDGGEHRYGDMSRVLALWGHDVQFYFDCRGKEWLPEQPGFNFTYPWGPGRLLQRYLEMFKNFRVAAVIRVIPTQDNPSTAATIIKSALGKKTQATSGKRAFVYFFPEKSPWSSGAMTFRPIATGQDLEVLWSTPDFDNDSYAFGHTEIDFGKVVKLIRKRL